MRRKTPHSPWPRPPEPGHRHGTAIIESVFCVPLIAVVLGLTFFFGWAMRNQQRVIISDRYAVWRRVVAGDAVGGGRLDRDFFGGQASSVAVDYNPPDQPHKGDETLEDYVSMAGQRGAAVEALAQSLVLERFPRSHSAEVSAWFPPKVGLWSRFTGAIQRQYVREGVEWRNQEAALEPEVRDQFFVPLDSALLGIPAPGDSLGQAFRNLYLHRWNARP